MDYCLAIKNNPKAAEAYNQLAMIEESDHNRKKAIIHYNKAIECSPDLKDYKKMIELYPQCPGG
jgi:tetratricopeptide (TPR) repeat protein